MAQNIRHTLQAKTFTASAPCRIDLGGTLDISSIFYPLAHLQPCTFNIALNMRTSACIGPCAPGRVKVRSRGFEAADYGFEEMPFDHPLGLIFAIAAYFRIDGVEIEIDSASPPRTALGGSSVAAVALIGAYAQLLRASGKPPIPLDRIPILAHAIEESIAGVPCGKQDQLAAAYGGIHAWHWKDQPGSLHYERQPVIGADRFESLQKRLLVAYCGVPHASADINGTWIRQFLAGRYRPQWKEIVDVTKRFIQALMDARYAEAARWMNLETEIRREMTPDVVDEIGSHLIKTAVDHNCGARFTGAGGGGCLWAIGSADAIKQLKDEWADILKTRAGAELLDANIDPDGLRTE